MARAVTLFAPGLIGYALLLHLASGPVRLGKGRAAAAASVVGWGVSSWPRSCSLSRRPPSEVAGNWRWAARSA